MPYLNLTLSEAEYTNVIPSDSLDLDQITMTHSINCLALQVLIVYI